MGLFDFFRRSDRADRSKERGWFAEGQPLHEALRLRVGEVGEPYSTHSVVYRCVSVIARSLAAAPFTIYAGDDSEPEVVSDGPWYRLFLRPNPYLTADTLWETTISHMQLGGSCYWVLEGAGDQGISEDEVPLEIWPLPGHCVDPVLDSAQRELLGYRITSGAGTIELPPHAVVAFRYFNPNDPWRGLSPMAAAMAGFRQDSKASAYNEAFYENGADPGGILTTEQNISPDQRTDLKRAWEDRHRGADKAYRVSVLGSGLKYDQLQVNHRDMQFLEQRRWNREEIAMVFGVPKFFLGVTDDLNYATSKSAERVLWTSTLIPLGRMISDQLEAQLFDKRDAIASDVSWGAFDTSRIEALREDLGVKLTSAEALRRLGYPLNEINERLDLGMEAQEGGDVGLLPMGLAPADEIAEGLDVDADLGAIYGPIGPGQDETEESAAPIRARGRTRRLQVWERLVRTAMDPAERRFRKRLNGYIRGRRAEVLRFIGDDSRGTRAPTTPGIEAFLAEARERWDEMLRKQLDPIYRHAIDSGAGSIGSQIGGLQHFSMESPEVLRFLAEKELRVAQVNDTILNNIRHQLLRGMAEGETVTQLQDRIRHTFNVTRSRARTIARTEAAQTVNGGRQLAMEAEGIKRTEWITSGDAAVRSDHVTLDGEVRELGQSFLPGVTLRHPGDMACSDPSLVINCRCTSGPVLD